MSNRDTVFWTFVGDAVHQHLATVFTARSIKATSEAALERAAALQSQGCVGPLRGWGGDCSRSVNYLPFGAPRVLRTCDISKRMSSRCTCFTRPCQSLPDNTFLRLIVPVSVCHDSVRLWQCRWSTSPFAWRKLQQTGLPLKFGCVSLEASLSFCRPSGFISYEKYISSWTSLAPYFLRRCWDPPTVIAYG